MAGARQVREGLGEDWLGGENTRMRGERSMVIMTAIIVKLVKVVIAVVVLVA